MAELPIDCLANDIPFTDPRQVGRLSVLSSELNRTAQSDDPGNKLLPPDYPSGSSSPHLITDLPSKMQLYLSLYDHQVLIDGGRTSFSLEKSSGKKIYLVSARSISTLWGDTPQCWRWNSDPDSRFGETAELIAVYWLEIRGRIRARRLSMATTYGVYLVYKLAEWADGFGLDDRPLEVAVGVSFRREMGKRACSVREGRERGDGWLEIKLGEYSNGGNPYHEVEGRLNSTIRRVVSLLKEILNEEDEKLKNLKRDLGDEVYNAVTKSL